MAYEPQSDEEFRKNPNVVCVKDYENRERFILVTQEWDEGAPGIASKLFPPGNVAIVWGEISYGIRPNLEDRYHAASLQSRVTEVETVKATGLRRDILDTLLRGFIDINALSERVKEKGFKGRVSVR